MGKKGHLWLRPRSRGTQYTNILIKSILGFLVTEEPSWMYNFPRNMANQRNAPLSLIPHLCPGLPIIPWASALAARGFPGCHLDFHWKEVSSPFISGEAERCTGGKNSLKAASTFFSFPNSSFCEDCKGSKFTNYVKKPSILGTTFLACLLMQEIVWVSEGGGPWTPIVTFPLVSSKKTSR